MKHLRSHSKWACYLADKAKKSVPKTSFEDGQAQPIRITGLQLKQHYKERESCVWDTKRFMPNMFI